jgi:hypothetical protein
MRYHTTATGKIPFTPDEEAARDAEEAAWLSDEPKRNALRQIAAIEAGITQRRQREALLNAAGAAWLAARDAEIAALRAQL